MIQVHLTRDSVAAGDDAEAPHQQVIETEVDPAAPDGLQRLIIDILGRHYLPSVAGQASWIAFSKLPLAIVSNLWSEPQMIWLSERDLRERLDRREDGLHLHFVYLAGNPPNIAFDVIHRALSALRL